MAKFIGRKNEINKINGLTRLKKACFVVIKGRRRIGKSRLATEWSSALKGYKTVYITGMAPEPGVTAEGEREDFAEQLSHQLSVPAPRANSWNSLLWALSERTKTGKWVIILDEINWLGRKDPLFLGQLKSTWDRDFSKNDNLMLIVSGSLSGWIKENILHSTGFLGRIDLDLTLDELSLPDCKEFLTPGHNHINNYETLKILGVTGGIPSYLEQIDCTQSAEDNLQRLCFEKSGFLYREFNNIFHDLFQEKNFYRKLIDVLAEKPIDLETIYQKLGVEKSGYISDAIDELIQAGFLARHYTWSLKTGKPSILSLIRVSDNYTRFYFKCIKPNEMKIQNGKALLPRNFYSILGLQFENLILKNRSAIWARLRLPAHKIEIDGPYFQRQTDSRKGCQVDYMIQCNNNTIYVVEVKFHKTSIAASIIEEVENKISAIKTPRGFSIRPILIHVNGVSDAVEESGYFDEIIDFGSLLSDQNITFPPELS